MHHITNIMPYSDVFLVLPFFNVSYLFDFVLSEIILCQIFDEYGDLTALSVYVIWHGNSDLYIFMHAGNMMLREQRIL